MRNYLKQFAIIFFPVTALFFAIAFFGYQKYIDESQEALQTKITTELSIGAKTLVYNLDHVISDLAIITWQVEQKTTGKMMDPEAVSKISQLALHMLKAKQFYDQIRYIDENGIEIVRADYRDGKPTVISDRNLLQDKSERYYFDEAIKLKKGEIYVSPFDLNVEKGEVEKPNKPTIRIISPVFDDRGRNRGIAILNYLGKGMVGDFKAVSDNAMIINSDGYWLSADKPELEFGFMFGKEESFAKRFPDSWQMMAGTENGFFKNDDGLFAFETIFPFPEKKTLGTTLKKYPTQSAVADGEKPYFWKLVSWVPDETLTFQARKELKKILIIFVPIYLIVILIVIVLVYLRLRYSDSMGTIEVMEASFEEREAHHESQSALIKEHLHTAIESFSDGFVLYDPQDRMIMCNHAFREMWAGINDLIKPGVYFHELAAAIETRGLARKEEASKKRTWVYDRLAHDFEEEFLEIQLADGRWILHHDHRTADGGHAGIRIDVTEKKQAEEQLRRAQKLEAVGQLTGGIAHDFNNILSIIMGNLEILQGMFTGDEKALDRIGKALVGANRAADITRKLLNFSRIEAKEKYLSSVNALIENQIDLIAKSLTALVKVEIRLADDLWPIAIDPGDLEDAILNLSLNARDAMPEGGLLIIETANKVLDENYVQNNTGSQAGEFVMILVSDNGMGMTRETQEKVFEPFFTTKGQNRGTGLGLSMVYGFVQRSGGHIKIDSEVGEGTTIRLYLPRARKEAEVSDVKNDSHTDLPRGAETILIVDDEEGLLDTAASYLQNLGYKTYCAASPKQALKVLDGNKDIDLMLSDIIMPGELDGYQLALAVHEKLPALKILLASGFTKMREDYLNSENKYLVELTSNLLNKPYNKSELAIAIRCTLDEES